MKRIIIRRKKEEELQHRQEKDDVHSLFPRGEFIRKNIAEWTDTENVGVWIQQDDN